MDPKRVRSQLDRILASATFAGAERASTFLRFVVERALEGRGAELKEPVIAIEALKRDASFDPKSDPIVRVEAGRLRDRLQTYYRLEGAADGTLIDLPKGGYVPEFAERSARNPPVSVLRLSILPTAASDIDSFAISPDGRILAFTASLHGTQVLWVRPLDSLEARPLADTVGASYPFWSPDSRSLGFFAHRQLRCITLGSGPARDLADVIVGRGAAWSPAGVILFCPRPLGPLYQVSEGGGEVTPVTTLDSARAELVHGFPQFLPDGRSFIYLAMSARADQSAIRVASLDAAAGKTLLTADTSAVYAPAAPGQHSALLFVAGDALVAQHLDLQRMELEGERTVVVPHVRFRRWYQARVSISAGGLLLYQTGSAEHHRFCWLGRDGSLLQSLDPRNDAISFNLSPDERRLAFYRDSDPATVCPKVWAMDLQRAGACFRLTDSEIAEPDFTPIWSPDGREVLFSRGDERRMRLMRQPLDGGPAVCILDSAGPKFPSDWSEDGRLVAYNSQAPDYRCLHVWIAAAEGRHENAAQPFLSHSYQEAGARFAPSVGGNSPQLIAHTSAETGRDEVYVRDFPSGARKWHVSSNGGFMPHWRSDGRELFYLAPDGVLMAVPFVLGATPEIGTPRPLFATGITFVPQYRAWMNQYAAARDGQRFLINRPDAESAAREITVVVTR